MRQREHSGEARPSRPGTVLSEAIRATILIAAAHVGAEAFNGRKDVVRGLGPLERLRLGVVLVDDRAHLHGIVPCRPDPASNTDGKAALSNVLPGIELLRPLAEYEQVAGGAW